MPQFLGNPMKHSKRETNPNRSKQRGLSLIELLVGLTIGLIILAAIGTVYVTASNLMRQREDQTQLNDPARVIMQTLRQDLMQAGYVDIFDLEPASNRPQAMGLFQPGNDVTTNVFVRNPALAVTTPLQRFFEGLTPVFGCDGAMNNTPNGIVSAGPPLAAACGAANATRHSLRVAYQAVPLTAANPTNSLIPANVNTGVGLDCLQQTPPGVAAPGVNHLVVNQYFIEDIGGIRRLRCAGSGANQAEDLALGVEEFVLRYQMSAPGAAAGPLAAAGGSQSQYLNAADVQASAQGWAGVTAVEICLISATEPTSRGAAAQGTVVLQPTRPTCQRQADGDFAANVARAAGDNRLWKRFTTVVSLRNAVYATPL